MSASARPSTLRDPPTALDLDGLYRAFAPRIREMVLRYTSDEQLADDVVQETFLRAHRYRGSFSARGRDPVARSAWWWLARIATRVCSSMREARAATPEILDPHPARGRTTPDPAETWTGILPTSLGAISENDRRALVLRYLGGLAYEEIALLEGIGLRGVDTRLTRARKRLRSALALVDAPQSRPDSRRASSSARGQASALSK